MILFHHGASITWSLRSKSAKKKSEFITQLERGLRESFQKSWQWAMVSENCECYWWQITWSHEVGCTNPTKDYVTL